MNQKPPWKSTSPMMTLSSDMSWNPWKASCSTWGFPSQAFYGDRGWLEHAGPLDLPVSWVMTWSSQLVFIHHSPLWLSWSCFQSHKIFWIGPKTEKSSIGGSKHFNSLARKAPRMSQKKTTLKIEEVPQKRLRGWVPITNIFGGTKTSINQVSIVGHHPGTTVFDHMPIQGWWYYFNCSLRI